MRWVAIPAFLLYLVVVALGLASLVTRDWYQINGSPATGGSVLKYGLFYICSSGSSSTVCRRYDSIAKQDGVAKEVHDGFERLFNAGIVCGASLSLATLEVVMSVICAVLEFFRDRKDSLSTCASRSGFTACFFALFGPVFWWFYGVAGNNKTAIPVSSFSNVKFGFWLPIVNIVLLIVAGLLLELVGKKANSVGSAV
eukprot:Amastigsp_a842064_437.p1 type:complete len:198 gc:universal Amastigsp_a842064_437:51-644(+)